MKDTSINSAASAQTASALTRLETMLALEDDKSRPPVHLWNPEARPDIGLAIQRDGTWTFEGSPIDRMPLVKQFASVLRREDDGRYFIVTPVEKVPIRVVDVPFLAVEMEARGDGETQELIWRTNLDDVVVAGADHPLRFEVEKPDGGLKPYVTIRGALEARVTRAVYYDLVSLAEVATIDGTAQFGVWSAGTFFAMAAADEIPDLDDESLAR